MKRPLVAVVSCYTVGLLLGEVFQPPLMALFAVSFIVLALAGLVSEIKKVKHPYDRGLRARRGIEY